MVSNSDEKENQDRKWWNLETKVQCFLSFFTLRRVHPLPLKCRKQMDGLAEKNYEKYRDLQKQKDTLLSNVDDDDGDDNGVVQTIFYHRQKKSRKMNRVLAIKHWSSAWIGDHQRTLRCRRHGVEPRCSHVVPEALQGVIISVVPSVVQ